MNGNRRAAAWGALAFAAYLANGRVTWTGDTACASLVPFALLTRGSLDLGWAEPVYRARGLQPYFLHRTPAGAWPEYPCLAGIALTPMYALPVALAARRSRAPAAWVDRAERWGKVAAAAVTAASVAVFVLVADALGIAPALANFLAPAFAFGSQALSGSAQALWQHGPGTLALLVLLLAAVRGRGRPGAGWPAAAGAAAGLAAGIRPANLLLAVPLLAWVWPRRTRQRVALLAPFAALAPAWFVHNQLVEGSLIGYQAADAHPGGFAGLAAITFSPARGLLPFFPVALCAVPGFRAVRRADPRRGVFVALARFAAAQTLLYGLLGDPDAGHTYGPRFLTEIEPALLLLAAPWLARVAPRPWRAGWLVALVGWSVALQGLMTWRLPRGDWNGSPVPVQRAPARIWEVADAPYVREARFAFGARVRPARPLTSWAAEMEVTRSATGAPGGELLLRVRVRNTGAEAWLPWGGPTAGPVHVACHLRDTDGRMLAFEGRRTGFARPVEPGEVADVIVAALMPDRPGRYVVETGLVQEGVGWFEAHGVRPARTRVVLVPPPPPWNGAGLARPPR